MQRLALAILLLALTSPLAATELDTIAQSPTWTDLAGDRAQLSLSLPDGDHLAVLRPADVRAPDFQVLVQGTDGVIRAVAAPEASVWTGQLLDRPDSRLVVRRQDDRLAGTLSIGGSEPAAWRLEATGNVGTLSRTDLGAARPGACAVADHAPRPRPHIDAAAKDAAAPVLICELACDTDVEFFTANNASVDDTVADIESIIAGVSLIYTMDTGIAYQITTILVREAEPDPYDVTNPYALLEQFSEEWRNNHDDIPRDLAHFFTGKDLDGSPVGIAWQDVGVCSTYNGYSLVQSMFSDDLAERIAVSAHEIGHTYDAVHCDYGASWWCRIMCASIGGCAGGFNSFGPETIEDIVAESGDVLCLDPGEVMVPTTTLPFSDDFQQSGVPDVTRWMAMDLAKNIYGRLELEAGDTWGVNELGTIRTLPMALDGGARLTFQWRSYGLPAGQPLRVEYFDSANWSWVLLHTIVATGGSSNPLADLELEIPATAAGDFFAIRFSADGNGGDSSDEWHIDNLLLEEMAVGVPGATPEAALSARVAPNPFNPATEIILRLPRDADVRVVARDAAGRQVSVIHDGRLSAGAVRLAWNGRDMAGRPLSSGAYIIEIIAGGERLTAKAVLLK